jgi:hypothetical protein
MLKNDWLSFLRVVCAIATISFLAAGIALFVGGLAILGGIFAALALFGLFALGITYRTRD